MCYYVRHVVCFKSCKFIYQCHCDVLEGFIPFKIRNDVMLALVSWHGFEITYHSVVLLDRLILLFLMKTCLC